MLFWSDKVIKTEITLQSKLVQTSRAAMYLQLSLFLWKSQKTLQLLLLPGFTVPAAGARLTLRFLPNGVNTSGCAKRHGGVDGNLLGLVGLQANVSQERTMCYRKSTYLLVYLSVICMIWQVCHWSDALTAVEVDEKHSFQMPVVDEGRMHARTRLMVDGEVTDVWVPPEQIILLFINDQFLQREHFSLQSTKLL